VHYRLAEQLAGIPRLPAMALHFMALTLLALVVFAVFFGLDFFATLPPTVKIASQAFGRDRAPVALGWTFTGHQLGAGAMAAAAGAAGAAGASAS